MGRFSPYILLLRQCKKMFAKTFKNHLTKDKKLDIILWQVAKIMTSPNGDVLKWWRGAPAKGVGRAIGARVQISSSPPKIRHTHSSVPYFSFVGVGAVNEGCDEGRGVHIPPCGIRTHRVRTSSSTFFAMQGFCTECPLGILFFIFISFSDNWCSQNVVRKGSKKGQAFSARLPAWHRVFRVI